MRVTAYSQKQFLERVGKKIREIRLRRNLSQFTLSVKSGLAASYISELEQGGRDVRVSTLYRIARALDVDICSLIKF